MTDIDFFTQLQIQLRQLNALLMDAGDAGITVRLGIETDHYIASPHERPIVVLKDVARSLMP